MAATLLLGLLVTSWLFKGVGACLKPPHELSRNPVGFSSPPLQSSHPVDPCIRR